MKKIDPRKALTDYEYKVYQNLLGMGRTANESFAFVMRIRKVRLDGPPKAPKTVVNTADRAGNDE